jgi:hypothetical protein
MKLVGGGAAANTRLKPLQDNDFVMAVVSFPPAFPGAVDVVEKEGKSFSTCSNVRNALLR